MIQEIEKLITNTQVALDEYRRLGRGIEALACNIRIEALKDALKVVKKYQK